MLERPEQIARAVVARLNSVGGEIMVPLDDEKRASSDGKRLREYLVGTIRPTPLAGEIRIESRAAGLSITVEPRPERRPYAQLREGGRVFVVQDGERVRPMTRDEVLARHDTPASARRRRDLPVPDGGLFWMRVEPSGPLALDLDLDKLAETDLLIDPTLTRNRRIGFNFTAAYVLGGRAPEWGEGDDGRRVLKLGRQGVFELTLESGGGLELMAPLESFSSGGATPPELGRLLWPLDLLEMPVSVFRLLEALYFRPDLWAGGILPAATEISAHMSLYGLRGWHLRPGSPSQWGYQPPKAVRYEAKDFSLDPPLVFQLEDLKEPDNCGYRLVRRLYEAFGFPEEAIPGELDRKLGRLSLPE